MTASPKPSDEIQGMNWLDRTLATPAENLACDEALLDLCENEGVEILRFWESHQPFVVVGYGNRVAAEVNVEACRRRGVPILRRCSGGGTVVQGPGCLNYSLTLRIPESGPLTTVAGTNQFVMERNRSALEGLLDLAVTVQGHTDLAFAGVESSALGVAGHEPCRTNNSRPSTLNTGPAWLKFSGNAQRRRRQSLLFHGTILHQFDLSLIEALLRFPSAQPGYRADRSHASFVRNIPSDRQGIQAALSAAWQVKTPFEPVPVERIGVLCAAQYENEAWTLGR